MTKQIIIVKIENEFKANGKGGGYNLLKVTFTDQGKVMTRNVMSFVAKQVYEVLKDAKPNDLVEVTEQPSKDPRYVEFASAKILGTAPASSVSKAVGGTSSGGTYATAEERAATQRNIVRQSTVGYSLTLHTLQGKTKASLDDVLKVASEIEEYVFNGLSRDAVSQSVASAKKANSEHRAAQSADELNDDIPY